MTTNGDIGAPEPSGIPYDDKRQAGLYWGQIEQLKAAAVASNGEQRTRLRKLQLEAEQRHFPEGFEPGRQIVALATAETRTYFLITYNLEAKS